MKTITLPDAQSRLSEVIQEVEAGGEVEITRHGVAVARIVPIVGGRVMGVREAIREAEAIRKSLAADGLGCSGEEIVQMVREGRR